MPVASMMWLKAGSPCCRPTFTSSCASHLSHAQLHCQHEETPAVETTLEETTFELSHAFLSNMGLTNMELRRVSTYKHCFHTMRVTLRSSMYMTLIRICAVRSAAPRKQGHTGAFAGCPSGIHSYIHVAHRCYPGLGGRNPGPERRAGRGALARLRVVLQADSHVQFNFTSVPLWSRSPQPWPGSLHRRKSRGASAGRPSGRQSHTAASHFTTTFQGAATLARSAVQAGAHWHICRLSYR